jgi:hypothetical protein
MSIYRDTNTDVTFEHPVGSPLVADVYRLPDEVIPILSVDAIAPVGTTYTLPLTFRETQYDGTLKIVWSGVDGSLPFSRIQYVDVVTPLVSLPALRTLFSDTNLTDVELSEFEVTARSIVQGYTGQNFGYSVGAKAVTGTGEKKISLPARLAKLTSIDPGPAGGYFTVSTDGWHLYINSVNLLDIKEAPPEEFIDNVTLVSGVIYVPEVYWRKFRYGAVYTVTGEWGYESVPQDVQEAAKAIVSDLGAPDSLYRERYLNSVKASDWQLAYNPGAFRGTGNARADQLLEQYRRDGMVII